MTPIPKEVSFSGFRFTDYHNGEQRILKPQLERLGYTNVQFRMGEQDSFGPLSRVIEATKDGKRHSFVYG